MTDASNSRVASSVQAIATRCALKIQKIVRGRRTRKLLLEGWSSEEDYIDSDSSGTETTDSG